MNDHVSTNCDYWEELTGALHQADKQVRQVIAIRWRDKKDLAKEACTLARLATRKAKEGNPK